MNSFLRDACKFTHIEYQWEKIKPPCFEKNIRYEGSRLETLTGYNVRTHILCQVCPVSTISNMYENWFCVQDHCDLKTDCGFWTWRIWQHKKSECILLSNKTHTTEEFGRISGKRECFKIKRVYLNSTKAKSHTRGRNVVIVPQDAEIILNNMEEIDSFN